MFTTLVTLIFLHGGPGLPDYLEPLFKGKFGKETKEVFYTQKQDGVDTMDDFVTELDGYVAKGEGKVFLVGHSWGGMLASEYALRFPDKIAGVVILSSAYSSAYKGQGKKLMADKGLGSHPLDAYLTKTEQKEWARFVQAVFEKENSPFYEKLNQSFLTKFDNASRLRKATFPVLNIFGDQDYCIVSSHERDFGKLNKRFQNLEIKGAAHFPFLLPAHREKVVAAIRKFVSRPAQRQIYFQGERGSCSALSI
jgi:pimeloyl-ACP methyl ester carboxylesterase